MRCEIITPQGLIYSHRVKSISLQSQNSGMTLLYNHMPIVTTVDIGVIKVIRVTDDKELPNYIAVNGGVLEMHDNVCTIVATYAIRARDIDDGAVLIEKQEAEAAAAAALSRKDVVAYKRAQLSLKRALNMLEVSKLKP
ncbi:ATP synthase F1 subunit epsilon [Ignavigranum ruoffiae]